MTTQSIITPSNCSSRRWRALAFLLITLLFVCFAALPKMHAVVPAPDGGYAGGNTAEGQSALFSLTSGGYNTAAGYYSLRTNAVGNFNTAIGAGDAPSQHRRGKHGHWCGSAFKQHHRQLQYCQRCTNAAEQHHRQLQYGRWF